ncbi:MAG TPA: F0F1 ATP synthase subunit delta [Candidatus Omnitrophota bacterium]|nr:F0F1 ATP synthase subunit delta [Candidatus Omnitrophota bacterium]
MQIIVFGTVLYFYKKITAGDTESTIKRLGTIYEDLLKKQKDLTEKLEAGERDLQAKKEEASAVAEKLSNQALDEARKKEDELLKKARAEAEEILSKAHNSRDQFYHELELAANKKMVDFVTEILKNVFDSKTVGLVHAQFIKNFIEQAQKSDLTSVDAQGQTPVIRSAMPLSKEEKEQLRQVLAEGMRVSGLQVEEALDEKLVAGVVLQIGTLILDGSFATSVREAADKVKEKLQTSS